MCPPLKRSFVTFVLWLMALATFGDIPGVSNATPGPRINRKMPQARYVVPKAAITDAPAITYTAANTYPKNVAIPKLEPINTGGAVPATIYSNTKIIAGTGQFGTVNGDMATAQFKLPYGISLDADGNTYIAESGGGIRMISAAGQVSSVGTDALPGQPFNVPKLNNPRGVVKDKSGNLFVANFGNHNILKITPAGVVTIFAGINQAGTNDGPGNVANIINPSGIAIDKDDNLYVTDGNNAIRKISPTGYVYTIAGQRSAGTVDGFGRGAKFNKPAGIAVDNNGNVYVADRGGFVIRKIFASGLVTTIAGSGVYGYADGYGGAASFQAPVGITVDASGNLYVTEDGAGTIRRITPDGEVKTIAGGGPVGTENGVGTDVHFSAPSGITIGPDGNLYVAEYGKNSVKRVIATGYTLDKALPSGLQFDPRTGIITGTPTVLWPLTDYTVTAYNGGGSSKFTFNIQVLDVVEPEISVGAVTGIISACVGSPSASTQQFTVRGSNLTDNITVSAPAGFEISTNPPGGYTNTFFMVAQGTAVTQRVIYVRAVATGAPANLSGIITLTSAGAVTKTVTVSATVYAAPTVDHVTDRVFTNGDVTTPLNFSGTGNTFYWTNDNTAIGLDASGQDNIPSFTAVNPGSSPVVANISVTSKVANLAYIPNYSSNSVSVINTITNKTVNTIPVGPNPGLVAISPDGKKVYVGDVGGTSLSIIDVKISQVKSLTIFDNPTGLIFSKDGTRAYVAGASGKCTVIDAATDAVLSSLNFFPGSGGIALSNDGQWIYVTNETTRDVRVYDTGSSTEITNIPAQGSHYAVTSPDGTKIYVAGGASNTIYVIDVATNTMLSSISLNSDANMLALSPDGTRIYVTNVSTGTLTVINATNDAVIASFPVGQSPEGVSVTPDGKYVYVVNVDSGTLSILETTNYTTVATIPAGLYPRAGGNFITPGANNCPGDATIFKITINPSATAITPGRVGGLITTCIGAPSINFQQFNVSGNNLSGNIKAAAPAGFEISFNQTNGFADILNITPTDGAVINRVIYVRAKASGTPAQLLGDVVLTTPGAASKNVTVKGVVNDLPKTDAINNLVYSNGDVVTENKFTGTANTYYWTNDNPSIGLAASGTGDIPAFTARNNGTQPVVANITFTPSSDGYLFLTGPANIIPVNTNSNKQNGIIGIGGEPVGTAVSPDGSLLAVTDAAGKTVKFINTTTRKVVSTVNNISLPIGICFSLDGKKVYVANQNTSNITVIDVLNARVENIVYVGFYPYGIAASPDGSTVYVGCTGENAVIAINTQTYERTVIPVVFGPTGIAVSPDNSRVYATSAQYNGLLKVLDVATKKVIANIPIGDVSTGICVSPDGKRVYVSNTQSNNVMVIDAEINQVIATIATGNHPFGLSITPDGKYLYVANDGTTTINVISTATNAIVNNITVAATLSKSFGNFFVSGTGCTGSPTKFTITVNGSSVITASAVTGTISACKGSSSTDKQQFKVSGSALSNNITVAAPANFQVSLIQGGSFASTVTITQNGGTVTDQIIYVRASAAAPEGNISGVVTLSSTGAPNQTVNVSGIVNALPTVNPVSPIAFNNGSATTAIHFTGTATDFTWINDNPAIGLPANGSGDIPSFTAVNNGQTPVTATITVVPSNALCGGSIVTFTITVNPTLLAKSSVSGSITACQGSASASPNLQQFSVTGSGLTNNVQLTAPANFEISLDPNTGYSSTVTISPIAGEVNNTIIYVRSSANAPVNNISGVVTIATAGAPNQTVNVSGIINALPAVNQPLPIAFNNGAATTAIHFTGTATTYTWTNDNPSIGLAANGSGDIPSFTAVNNGQTVVTATITVTPSNASCAGSSVTFKIAVNPTPVPAITTGGNLSAMNTVYGTPSAPANFSVSGDNLLSAVVITPASGFEVSADGVNFRSTVTIGGNTVLSATTVYIRLAKTTFAGNYAGNILLNTQGASITLVIPSSTVSRAPILVTADNKTRSANSENSRFTITYNGFVNNENESNLVKKPEVSTTATFTSAAGTYPITFTGFAESLNYTFTYNAGVLTITPTGLVFPNTFTPNGDGINDTWVVKFVEYFPKCTIDIFNRAGAKMFSSVGYKQEWDGKVGGNPVPAGTYYYVINLKDNSPIRSGWLWVTK